MTAPQNISDILDRLTDAQKREMQREYPRSVVLADWRVFPGLKKRGLLATRSGGVLYLTGAGLKVQSALREGKRS